MCVTCAIYLKIGVESEKKKLCIQISNDVAWFMSDI